tara:strand:+ start:107 stop:283 length:177 start_codon:yes stop_codon:yes gene_type:complete
MKKRTPLLKKKKHSKIVNDYDKQKARHLEKLADKMLEDQEKLRIFKDKKSDGKFLDLF